MAAMANFQSVSLLTGRKLADVALAPAPLSNTAVYSDSYYCYYYGLYCHRDYRLSWWSIFLICLAGLSLLLLCVLLSIKRARYMKAYREQQRNIQMYPTYGGGYGAYPQQQQQQQQGGGNYQTYGQYPYPPSYGQGQPTDGFNPTNAPSGNPPVPAQGAK